MWSEDTPKANGPLRWITNRLRDLPCEEKTPVWRELIERTKARESGRGS